jgi:hypothetical protein
MNFSKFNFKFVPNENNNELKEYSAAPAGGAGAATGYISPSPGQTWGDRELENRLRSAPSPLHNTIREHHAKLEALRRSGASPNTINLFRRHYNDNLRSRTKSPLPRPPPTEEWKPPAGYNPIHKGMSFEGAFEFVKNNNNNNNNTGARPAAAPAPAAAAAASAVPAHVVANNNNFNAEEAAFGEPGPLGGRINLGLGGNVVRPPRRRTMKQRKLRKTRKARRGSRRYSRR